MSEPQAVAECSVERRHYCQAFRQGDADAVRAIDRQIPSPDRSASWDEYVRRFLAASSLGVSVARWSGSEVAEIDGQIVGFLLAETEKREFGLPTETRVVAVAVRPEVRRRGIGRRLIDALKAHCRENGVAEITAVLRVEDERDVAFLRACAFEPSSRRFVHASERFLSCKVEAARL